MPDYSLDRLPERAEAAKFALAELTTQRVVRYTDRWRDRAMAGVIPTAFLGHGRAGKDTAAEFLCPLLSLTNPGSASLLAKPYVAHMAREDADACYEKRHGNRNFWYHACNALREGDYAFLARMGMAIGDVLIGLRDAPELQAAKDQGIVKLVVWVDNPRVPPDPTVTFAIDDCDLVVRNAGTIEQFHEKLRKLAPLIRR